jgi:hypothetical protein
MVEGSWGSSCSYCHAHRYECGQFEPDRRVTTSPYPRSQAFKATIESEPTFKTSLLDSVHETTENLQGTFAYLRGMMDFKREGLGMESGDMPWVVSPFCPDIQVPQKEAGEVRGRLARFRKERERVRKARFSLAKIRKVEGGDLERFEAEVGRAGGSEGFVGEVGDRGEGCSYRVVGD